MSASISPPTKLVMGPFIGDLTSDSVKLWINVDVTDGDKQVFLTLKLLDEFTEPEIDKQVIQSDAGPASPFSEIPAAVFNCTLADHGTGVVTLTGLKDNARYSYCLWQDHAHTVALDLLGLTDKDLWFITLPTEGYEKQLDFLLMSCHNPHTAPDDGCAGFAVWRQIPEIMRQNVNVRFAILVGDQVYADEVEADLLKERDPIARQRLYLRMYHKFWDSSHYRRVFSSLPAVLMWDDHDITDGWGSREDSFCTDPPDKFLQEWCDLLQTAKRMFALMQASRNPEPLSKDFKDGFDTCFRIGKGGFVVADLRSNRNLRKNRIWNPEQLEAIKAWVDANKSDLNTLFFVSSVVFSHGAPHIESWILNIWFRVLTFVKRLERLKLFPTTVAWFNSSFGDLRDDINDSWGAEANAAEAQRVLDYLFELANPPDGQHRLNVVILSGDIHTPGYSTIYSANPKHKKAVIPHIVATPVAYEPFSWLGEAVFRHVTKVVALGTEKVRVVDPDTGKVSEKPMYTSQVSHHFCYRNVEVVSLRSYEADEAFLKVKYYLEGFPEPQIMLFDLNHGARVENIEWPVPPRKKKGFLLRMIERILGMRDDSEQPSMASPSYPLPDKVS